MALQTPFQTTLDIVENVFSRAHEKRVSKMVGTVGTTSEQTQSAAGFDAVPTTVPTPETIPGRDVANRAETTVDTATDTKWASGDSAPSFRFLPRAGHIQTRRLSLDDPDGNPRWLPELRTWLANRIIFEDNAQGHFRQFIAHLEATTGSQPPIGYRRHDVSLGAFCWSITHLSEAVEAGNAQEGAKDRESGVGGLS